jgi:hypothetical protein
MGKILVTFTDEQEEYIKTLKGKLGKTKAAVVRNIIISRMDREHANQSWEASTFGDVWNNQWFVESLIWANTNDRRWYAVSCGCGWVIGITPSLNEIHKSYEGDIHRSGETKIAIPSIQIGISDKSASTKTENAQRRGSTIETISETDWGDSGWASDSSLLSARLPILCVDEK